MTRLTSTFRFGDVRRVSDALYADAAKHYDEADLMTLAGVVGPVGFFIPLAMIGLPTPGLPPEQHWRA